MFKLKNVNCLRGNTLKVLRRRCELNFENIFNQRIVNVWNSLPNKVVCRNTPIEFKNRTNYYNEYSLYWLFVTSCNFLLL